MSTSLGAILDRSRALYLEELARAVAERAEGRVLTEQALRDASGAVVVDGPWQLGVRVDIVVLPADGSPRTDVVDAGRRVSFDAMELAWERDVRVRIAPFSWDGCSLILEDAADVDPLRRWFVRWFDAEREEPRDPDEAPWLGVAHFMSDPQVDGDRARLMVDLGTAPVTAFEELLDAARATGARALRVGAGA